MAAKDKFWTGLITSGNELHQPGPPFKGAGWEVDLGKQRKNPPSIYNGKEIILHASSWASAQRTLDLIVGCHHLLRGDPPPFDFQPIAHNETDPAWMPEFERQTRLEAKVSTPEFPLACAIAAKASRRRRYVYAIAKYKFSLTLFSVNHIDLDPWSSNHYGVSSFPDEHIIFSHAIISAYSAIEDLGLEIRASTKKPSRIGGKWNPVVKQDLEQRLKKSGVNLNETILWTARGSKRNLEKKRPIPAAGKAPWSAGTIRDSELQIIDAVAYVDWLRDCVASHGVKDLTRVLSPHDVVNTQNVTRRLLLESLGFWRWHENAAVRTSVST